MFQTVLYLLVERIVCLEDKSDILYKIGILVKIAFDF